MVIPAEPKPDPPPVPVAEIIKRFSENEQAMLLAHAGYGYKKVVRVEELDETASRRALFNSRTELTQLPDGRTYERELKHPETSLNVLNLEPESLNPLLKIPPLPFIPSQLVHYDVNYVGTQKLDELNTYIFRIEPKQVERQRAYFKGVIWVDDQDFVIVKTLGHWVTELGEISTDNFPFKFFDTYRENVAGENLVSELSAIRRFRKYKTRPGARAADCALGRLQAAHGSSGSRATTVGLRFRRARIAEAQVRRVQM